MCNFIISIPYCFWRRRTKKIQQLFKVKLDVVCCVNNNTIFLGSSKYKAQAEDFAEFCFGNLMFVEDISHG